MIAFFVPGIPIPQGSHRVSRSGHIYDSNKNLTAWRDTIRKVASTRRPLKPIDTPVKVEAAFFFEKPRTTRFKEAPSGKGPGDLDKLLRAIGDGLEQSRILTNDARIVEWHATKSWCRQGEKPGAKITSEKAHT